MASGKQNRQDRLRGVLRPASGANEVVPVSPASDAPPIAISTVPPVDEPNAALIEALRPQMRELAVRFVGARRRSGQAILEMGQILAQANDEAQYGEWDDYLQAVDLSDDTARKLMQIFRAALDDAAFADGVRRNWFQQSVAMRIVRERDPDRRREVIDALLSPERTERPSDAETGAVIRRVRQRHAAPVDVLPEAALERGSDDGGSQSPTAPERAVVLEVDSAAVLAILQGHAAGISELVSLAGSLPRTPATEETLQQLEQAIAAIRRATRGA